MSPGHEYLEYRQRSRIHSVINVLQCLGISFVLLFGIFSMGDFVHAGDSKIARCAVNELACTVEFVAGISGFSGTQRVASSAIGSQSQFYTQGNDGISFLLPYEYSQQIRLNQNGFVQGPQSQTGATEADVLAGRQNTVSQASRIHGSGSAGH